MILRAFGLLNLVQKPLCCALGILALWSCLAEGQSRMNVAPGDYHYNYFALETKTRTQELLAEGYEPFDREDYTEDYRPIEFVITDLNVASLQMLEFLDALSSEKKRLMEIYGISNHVYNNLALMAVGILGNETDFFRSPAYQVFAFLPDEINFQIKRLDNFLFNGGAPTDDLSKGPTRMKSIPEKITEHYQITHKEQLEVPFNAAVATLGYLANTRQELIYKIKSYEMKCVTETNFYDVLLYLYFGGRSYREKLVKCDIEPHRNTYVSKSHKNRRTVRLLEKRNIDTP